MVQKGTTSPFSVYFSLSPNSWNIHKKRVTLIESTTIIFNGAPKLMWHLNINLDTEMPSALDKAWKKLTRSERTLADV